MFLYGPAARRAIHVRGPRLDGRCSATTSTPAGAARAPSWARRMPVSSPTRPTAPRTALGSIAPGMTWLEPARSAEAHYRNKAKLVVGGAPWQADLRDPRRARSGRRPASVRPLRTRSCRDVRPAPPLRVHLGHRAVRRARPARGAEARHRHALPRRRAPRAVRVARSADSVDLIRAALPQLLTCCRRHGSSPSTSTRSTRPSSRATPRSSSRPQSLLPMRVGDVTLLLGPRAFFQTNTRVAEALYAQAREWAEAHSPTTVWDLYCGVGGFALHLAAADRHVVGVETSAEAVEAARAARARLPESLSATVEFVAADATLGGFAAPSPNLVVVNPPRRGHGPRARDLARPLRRRARRVLQLPPRQPRARPLPDALPAGHDRAGLRHVPRRRPTSRPPSCSSAAEGGAARRGDDVSLA